jgi:4,5-dihydroxyphthalate decarboxylase
MSTELPLSLAFGPNPRSEPILDGTVEAEGIEFSCSRVSAGELFHRQLTHQEFDVSEMSISTLLIITAQGNTDWVGLPIFTTRQFFGTMAIVREGAGIDSAEDLKGKRVGVNEYQQTAALWSRGFFEHEYGVGSKDVDWFMERTPEYSHAGATGFKAPEGVNLNFIPPEKSMASMMMDGELDAIQHYFWGGGINRSTVDLVKQPGMRQLFADPMAESARYYKKTGIFPFNHTMILRRSIYEQHPWVARNILEAFEKAKDVSYRRTREGTQPWLVTGLLESESQKASATDLFPYGLAANRMVIEAAMEYSHEQGLTPRVLTPEEFYAPTMLDS